MFRFSVLCFFLVTGCSHFPSQQDEILSPKHSLAIMQAKTTARGTHIVVSSHKSSQLKAFLTDKKSLKPHKPSEHKTHSHPGSDWVLHHFHFSDLPHKGPYQFKVLDQNMQMVDQRQLELLDGSIQKLSWAVVSCMRDDLKDTDKIWQQLLQSKPHVIMMIGDNSYADLALRSRVKGADPAHLWKRHMETRRRLALFRSPHLIPVFATWDDHDYGINDGGVDYKYKKESQKLFRKFFPFGAMDFQKRGVAQKLKLSGQQFLFLDNRSFRQASPKGAHFGDHQKQWIVKQVKDHPGPTWLLSGDQFFGAHHPFESMAGRHPKALEKLLTSLKKIKKPVAFVSGDRHLSEVMALPEALLGYPTYEITSSPIHSTVYSGSHKRHPNPYQLEGVDGVWNYVLIDSQVMNHGMEGRARAFDQQGTLLFHVPLNVSVAQ